MLLFIFSTEALGNFKYLQIFYTQIEKNRLPSAKKGNVAVDASEVGVGAECHDSASKLFPSAIYSYKLPQQNKIISVGNRELKISSGRVDILEQKG